MAGYATPSWVDGITPPGVDAASLKALGYAVELAEHPYGTCATAAGTAAKTVNIDFSGSLTLFTGLSIKVKFNNANTAASPTLNVNGTGAKSIVAPGFTGTVTWSANQILDLTYNGSQWVIFAQDVYNKTQSLSSTTASAMNTKFGSTPATPDAALALLTSVIPTVTSNAKVSTGSYTGTGTSGASNPTVINCGFVPKLVIISENIAWSGTMFLWFAGLTSVKYATTAEQATVSVSGNTLRVYCATGSDTSKQMSQMNLQGRTYYWFAIGV